MTMRLIFDLVRVIGGAGLVLLFAQVLWAMIFRGPGQSRWLRADATKDGTYWVLAVVVGAMMLLFAYGVVETAAKLLRIRWEGVPNLGFALLGLFAAAIALISGWGLWTGLKTGETGGMSGGRVHHIDRHRQPVSYWLMMLCYFAVCVGCLGAVGFALALTLGLSS